MAFDAWPLQQFMFCIPHNHIFIQEFLLPLPLLVCPSCKSQVQHRCQHCALCAACSRFNSFDRNYWKQHDRNKTCTQPLVLNHVACHGMRSGVFNAALPLPPPFVVEEENTVRKQSKIGATADGTDAAEGDGIDFHHLDLLVDQHSNGAWSRGAENVIFTMNRTAAAFAFDKHDSGSVFEAESDVAEGVGEVEGSTRQSVAGKLGAKWKGKVFRYKGEADGAGSDVLNQLLQHNPLDCREPSSEDSKGSNQQKLEDLLKGMSSRFVEAMQAAASVHLDGLNVDHVIGPFKTDLDGVDEIMQEAANLNHRMRHDAEELKGLFQKVSECRCWMRGFELRLLI
jgi:hypothetical protein